MLDLIRGIAYGWIMSHGPLFQVGIAFFFLGMLTIMGIVFTKGGAQKSKQFRVIGEIASGRLGRGARIALLAGFASVLAGMCATFAGVAESDRARAKKCVATCRARGYAEGKIQAFTAPQPNAAKRTPVPACACMRGPAPDPLELRADSL